MATRSRQPGTPERRRISRKEMAARRQRYADLQWLMADARGRRIVWQWLDAAGVYRSSFAPNALDMAHNEGRRNWGVQTLSELLAYAPEHYLQMTREHSPTAAAILKDELIDDDTESES